MYQPSSSIPDKNRVDSWPVEKELSSTQSNCSGLARTNGGVTRRAATTDKERRGRRVDSHQKRVVPWPDDEASWQATIMTDREESRGEERKRRNRILWKTPFPSEIAPPKPFILVLIRKLSFLRYNFYVLNPITTSKISANSSNRLFNYFHRNF